jgi:hypothetical protein
LNPREVQLFLAGQALSLIYTLFRRPFHEKSGLICSMVDEATTNRWDQPGVGNALNGLVRGEHWADRPHVMRAIRACTRCGALAEDGVLVPKLTAGQVGWHAVLSDHLARVGEAHLEVAGCSFLQR